MPTKKDFSDLPIEPDGSWCDPDDLWGINSDTSCLLRSYARRNPTFQSSFKMRKSGPYRVLLDHGIKLSDNFKTRLTFNMSPEGSCWPTAACREYCYRQAVTLSGGWSPHKIKQAMSHLDLATTGERDLILLHEPNMPGPVKTQIQNLWAIKRLASRPRKEIENVADAFVEVCWDWGQDNLRWHGVGDLIEESILLINTIGRRHPDFIVWGFTRKPQMAMLLERRDNIVFWLSCDESSQQRLPDLLDACDYLGTTLAYTTLYGDKYTVFSEARPRKKIRLTRRITPKAAALVLKNAWRDDPMLPEIYDLCDVVFGYHGKGITTHVGVANECPATDPLGGGHFVGACQECRWCMEHHTVIDSLKRHRIERNLDEAIFYRRWPASNPAWLYQGRRVQSGPPTSRRY